MLLTADPKLRAFLDAAAALAGLPAWSYAGTSYSPGQLLEGIILTESGGRSRARRYEPHQDRATRRDAPQDPDTPDTDDGELEDDASYGPMQVMGYNARTLCGVPAGTPMRFAWLFRPQVNVALGLRILLEEIAAVEAEADAGRFLPGMSVTRALCRYNGGPTGDDPVDGDIRLRRYVEKVASHARLAQQDRRARGWFG